MLISSSLCTFSCLHCSPICLLKLQTSDIFFEEAFLNTRFQIPSYELSKNLRLRAHFTVKFHVFVDELMSFFFLDCKLQEGRDKVWLCLPFHHQDLGKKIQNLENVMEHFSNEWMNSDYCISCINLLIHYQTYLKFVKSYYKVFSFFDS